MSISLKHTGGFGPDLETRVTDSFDLFYKNNPDTTRYKEEMKGKQQSCNLDWVS